MIGDFNRSQPGRGWAAAAEYPPSHFLSGAAGCLECHGKSVSKRLPNPRDCEPAEPPVGAWTRRF